MTTIVAPAFIRGRIVETDMVRFAGRGGEADFLAPDPMSILSRLPLANPGDMRDLYAIGFDEILDYLAALGEALRLDRNADLQEALEHSYPMSDLTPVLLRGQYLDMPMMFDRRLVREMAELSLGIANMEGWNGVRPIDGRAAAVRAFGARALHIVPGNSPLASALTIIRNAITRSDAIVKAPSNDPLTALAIARTMARMAPDHPITRHLATAYWKGGSTAFEERLYDPANIEKIVAWGGFASVKHVTRYIQPGLELISLDPKRSATIIGPEAFRDDATMHAVARRAAADVGVFNQLGCVNARVIYVASGCDAAGLERANRFGRLLFDAVQALPGTVSTPAKRFDPELRARLRALKTGGFYRIFGGEEDEGAVIVSQLDEPVDFYPSLAGRVANVVPVEAAVDALRGVNSYTQTIGIWPESLKTELRDLLPLYGAQRLVSLGYAVRIHMSLPQDAIEPIRRMVRWIVDDGCDPDVMPPVWAEPSEMAERWPLRVSGTAG